MKILLTNDDGYFSKGIVMLDEMLSEVGDVTIVAPENNHSGASSSLTLKNPLRIRKYKDNGFYVNGTPADCVFMALTRILKSPPDILISGINHGANLGDDVLYSGTVGAAMGGRFHPFPSLAVSITNLKPDHFATAVEVVREIIEEKLDKLPNPSSILNINVPDIPIEQIEGYSLTCLGRRELPENDRINTDAYGNEIHWVGPPPEPILGEEGTDFDAISKNRVSITPLETDFTDFKSMDEFQNWL